MRIRFPDGGRTILTYCTNVHAIEDLESVLAALARYCAPVRRRLGVRRLALGLWLSRRSASELLASPDACARLREALEANGLEVVTLNGFPYGDFPAERVKEEGHRPDWPDVRRHHYTPEPDCIVETSEQAIAFFHDRLRPAVRRRGVDPSVVDRHLGLCFDACHQAVEFEDPAAAWRKIAEAGIRVGKVQLSCALELPEE